MQPVNPYVAGAPLRGARGFFGRQDTLEWVVRELHNPTTNALVLSGQRRIGKTTLLLQLERTLPADAFLPVYFDLQDQATRPLGRVLADLGDTVAEQAGLGPPDPDDFDDQGRFFRHTFLVQLYQALEENRRLVLLLDEFDVLDQAAEAELPETAAAKAFFPFLRRVMTEDPRPAFVFVVGRRAEDLSLDFTATFKASLVREIWVLDRESAETLVRQAEANGTLRFTDQAVVRILILTHCHPYLTQLLCQRVWERAYAGDPTAPPRVDVPAVEAAVPDALEAGDQALVWLWNGLSPAEKIYAAALAAAADEGETISEHQVIQVLTAHAARLRTREVELAPRDLVKRRVLEEAGERAYRFAVELCRRWMRQNKPLRGVKDELDRVDPLAEQLFGVGQGFFRRRQWEPAVRYFRDALEANSRHFRARLHLGEALLERGQTDRAVVELERAYELDREEARLPLARALVTQAFDRKEAGDEDGALASCERALQISPDERVAQRMRAAIWTRRGDAALERDDGEAALAAYREAGDAEKIAQVEGLRREEKELASLFGEGMRALERQDWKQAQRAFAEVVHRRPDYEKDGQLAVRLLERAVAEKKAMAPALRLRSWAWVAVVVVVAALLVGLAGQGLGGWLRSGLTGVPTEMPAAAPTDLPMVEPTEAPPEKPAGEPAPLSAGDTLTRPTDGMAMVYVPAGEFQMGSMEGGSDEQPVHTVALDGFWIDQTEVTNAQFAAFLNERGNQTAGGVTWLELEDENCLIERVGGKFQPKNGYADHPVVEVSWYGAAAYCEWAGGRLPTEAEWEYAARGEQGYIYPWGDTFDGTRLNFCDVNCTYSWKKAGYGDGYERTAPVGSYPDGASWCGAQDLTGNVWEWVGDWYGDYPSGRQVNPMGPSSGEYRVLRGGSWGDGQRDVRAADRYHFTPDDRNIVVGFRCVGLPAE